MMLINDGMTSIMFTCQSSRRQHVGCNRDLDEIASKQPSEVMHFAHTGSELYRGVHAFSSEYKYFTLSLASFAWSVIWESKSRHIYSRMSLVLVKNKQNKVIRKCLQHAQQHTKDHNRPTQIASITVMCYTSVPGHLQIWLLKACYDSVANDENSQPSRLLTLMHAGYWWPPCIACL